MTDNRTASAIDLALQKYDTPVGPVYFVQRNGWKRRTSRREAKYVGDGMIKTPLTRNQRR
ncbi:hypothetical protein H1F79_005313, partial [Salmonella enterica]|nr:hypothetical protein [Salmonella enterica]